MTDEERFSRFEALGLLFDDEGAVLWREYLSAEKKNIRKQAHSSLEHLLAYFRSIETDQLDAWINAYCDAVLATGLTNAFEAQQWSPVRFNLLRDAVLPRLIEGYHRRDAASYARLVILCDHIYYKAPRDFYHQNGLPETAVLFLEEALRINPDDALARNKLIAHMYRYLDYVIHEVPHGVLMGELQEELEWIARFETLVQRAGREDKFREAITEFRLYIIAWDDFLKNRNRYQSFAAYLYCHQIPF